MVGVSPLILIVDDESDLRSVLDYNLKQAGYRTRQAAGGAEAIAQIHQARPDIMLLDLNLPDLPGVEVCRRLKADPATASIPIVMLTARGSEADRIVGLELGAVDYLAKPFSVRELILRLDLVRRRLPPGEPPTTLKSGPVELDITSYVVRVGGEEVSLALLEFRLLAFLLEAAGRVRTREELLTQVWHYPGNLETRTVETHIKRLRAKLGPAGDVIETVRGVGYRVRSSADDPAR